MQIGLERIADEKPVSLDGTRFGLLMNRASVDQNLRFACDVLNDAYPGQLAAIFTPQHGLWGEQQANMIESPHGRHPEFAVPIYSLYSETRQPTAEMLDGLDCFVVDLQDVGCRVYTFVWTVLNCLRACAEAGLPMLVLDRPNPLGNCVEGPLLKPEFRSFVGGASIPMRHGQTLGQLAQHLNKSEKINAELQVIRVCDCPPEAMFDHWDRQWIPPSPNLPTFQSALVYPGQVLLEGTNISEGRGTTTPFEVCGAPFINEFHFCELLTSYNLPGVSFLPIRYVPTFDKWTGESCGGVSLQVSDQWRFRPYLTTLIILATLFQRWPDHAEWLPPPYEYETEKMPIDILSGNTKLRESIASIDCSDWRALDELACVEVEA